MRVWPKLIAKLALVMGIVTWSLGWALDRYEISYYLPSCYCFHREYPYLWISHWIILLSIVLLVSAPVLYIVEERQKMKEMRLLWSKHTFPNAFICCNLGLWRLMGEWNIKLINCMVKARSLECVVSHRPSSSDFRKNLHAKLGNSSEYQARSLSCTRAQWKLYLSGTLSG